MDLSFALTPDLAAIFATLFVLELVLGIDNVIFISILAAKLPVAQQARARNLGLTLAMILRVGLVLLAGWIITLKDDVVTWGGMGFSVKDFVLIAGGGFLVYKAVMEIHHRLEGEGEEHAHADDGAAAAPAHDGASAPAHDGASSPAHDGTLSPAHDGASGAAPGGAVATAASVSFRSVLAQILALDIVFSLDSVITAVGMTDNLVVIISAVVVSFGIMLFAARFVFAFVNRHPTVKMLALSFLLLIGVFLVAEGFGYSIDKAFIYGPMAFAIFVEGLNLLAARRRAEREAERRRGLALRRAVPRLDEESAVAAALARGAAAGAVGLSRRPVLDEAREAVAERD